MTRLREILTQLQPLDLNYGRPLEAFTVFPKLPLELKKKIWKYLIEEPRMIRLHQVTWEDDNLSNPVMISQLYHPRHVFCFFFLEGVANFHNRRTPRTSYTPRLPPSQDRRTPSL